MTEENKELEVASEEVVAEETAEVVEETEDRKSVV